MDPPAQIALTVSLERDPEARIETGVSTLGDWHTVPDFASNVRPNN